MLSEKEIDEIIAYAEETAVEQTKLMNRYDGASGYSRSHNEKIRGWDAIACEKCAADHRNIAEGFKELKAARRMLDALGWHYHNGCYYNDKAYKENLGGKVDRRCIDCHWFSKEKDGECMNTESRYQGLNMAPHGCCEKWQLCGVPSGGPIAAANG